MVDYYGMPSGWPGRANPFTAAMSASDKAEEIEHALLQDICDEMGTDFNPDRFLPYVMMHEFEAMLFSDCDSFGHAIRRPDLTDELQRIRDAFNGPEAIDDSPSTAPSKRIEELFPEYDKLVGGTVGVLGIGLDTIRSQCPHFDAWLRRLETLP